MYANAIPMKKNTFLRCVNCYLVEKLYDGDYYIFTMFTFCKKFRLSYVIISSLLEKPKKHLMVAWHSY
jgi:hypothetical protein